VSEFEFEKIGHKKTWKRGIIEKYKGQKNLYKNKNDPKIIEG